MVHSVEDSERIAALYPALGQIEPLNTDAGQDFMRRLCIALKPDAVIFDNLQSLIVGVQKDEETWIPTLGLVQWLTSRRMGQLRLDHTNSAERQYGTITKSWRFDTVGLMAPLEETERQPHETAFALSFDKARRRTPANWEEFAPSIIRLRDDVWTGEPVDGAGGKGKVRPSRQPFYDALVTAIVRNGSDGETTMEAWEAQCVHRWLIDPPGKGTDGSRRIPLRRAQTDLIAARWIAVEGVRVIDLQHRGRG